MVAIAARNLAVLTRKVNIYVDNITLHVERSNMNIYSDKGVLVRLILKNHVF